MMQDEGLWVRRAAHAAKRYGEAGTIRSYGRYFGTKTTFRPEPLIPVMDRA